MKQDGDDPVDMEDVDVTPSKLIRAKHRDGKGTRPEIGGKAMTQHEVGTQEQWQAARDQLQDRAGVAHASLALATVANLHKAKRILFDGTAVDCPNNLDAIGL